MACLRSLRAEAPSCGVCQLWCPLVHVPSSTTSCSAQSQPWGSATNSAGIPVSHLSQGKHVTAWIQLLGCAQGTRKPRETARCGSEVTCQKVTSGVRLPEGSALQGLCRSHLSLEHRDRSGFAKWAALGMLMVRSQPHN